MFSKPTSQRGLYLLIAILLFGATAVAQDARKAQENAAAQLMSEALELVSEGSPESFTKAIEKLELARTSLHLLNIPEGEGVTLLLLGYIYDQLDQDQKAIEKYEESLPLFRAGNFPKGEALALLHLGLLHGRRGEMQKALDSFNRALPLFRAAGEPNGEMLVLSTMASLLIMLGKPDEGLNYFNQAFEVARAAGPRESQAVAPNALDPLLKVTVQPEQVRDNLKQAVSLFHGIGFPRGEAIALLTLGLANSFESEPQKALEYYGQALPIFRTEHDRLGEGAALFGLCMSHVSLRDYQKWVDYCGQAEAVARATGDRQSESLTLKQIAIGEGDRGNLAGSKTAIESAIAIIESLRTKVINPELRVSYFEGSQDYYDFYIDLLMRLHKQNPNDGYDGKALEASERARARSLLEILTEANADIRQGVDATLLQREREIQRRLNAKAETQMRLFSGSHSETEVKALAEEIQTLIEDLQQVETEIRQKNPRYAALTQPRPLTLKEIQTQVLDPDTLLLEYSLGEERSFVWAVTSNSITSRELPKRADIETASRRFYDLLIARNTGVTGETEEKRAQRVAQSDAEIPLAAASLSRMVLAPVAELLGNKRLMIVADDALHFVPFGSLPVVTGGASSTSRQRRVTRPLIEDHEIVNLPSASTLAVLRSELVGRTRAPKSVVALADPVFMKNDERVKKVLKPAGETSARPETRDPQLVKASEETGVSNNEVYIPRLPGTRQEAEQIVAMVPADERRLALDFAASRDTVTSAELGQYRYVHLSTHGLLDSVHPELSGLVFSLVNERGETQDGFLRAHEIFNLKLSPEVVVLSACQTGMGKNIKGEGLVSLTRGFMYAGAPRVVVSLWGISDWGTTELMVRFYHGMLKEGMRPAAALRAAQISLMKDQRWASPYYWAPFTLQGEWR